MIETESWLLIGTLSAVFVGLLGYVWGLADGREVARREHLESLQEKRK